MFRRVAVNARPIRFGFAVDITDLEEVSRAIKISSSLWGSVYNPLLPLLEEVPENWTALLPKRLTPQKILSGYLDAYDPDIIVTMNYSNARGFNFGNREVINVDELLANAEIQGHPIYGTSIFGALESFYEDEFKFVRREPISFIYPKWHKQTPLFDACFGALFPALEDHFEKEFAKDLEVAFPTCDYSNFLDLLTSGSYTLNRISKRNTEQTIRHQGFGHCIFFLDADNALDIVDYWNLRALGWRVVPYPKQIVSSEKPHGYVGQFIQEHHFPDKFSPEYMYEALVLKSRSTLEPDFKLFAQSIRAVCNTPFITSTHYPRIWDNWARQHDHAESGIVRAKEDLFEVEAESRDISFKVVNPGTTDTGFNHHEYLFANDIEIRSFHEVEPLAEIIPEGGRQLAEAIEGFRYDHWRFSRRGITYMPGSYRDIVRFKVPHGEPIFLNWLKENGLTVSLSPPGKVAKKMLQHLGGINNTAILTYYGILDLLRLLEDGRDVSYATLKDKLQETVGRHKNKISFENLIKRLSESRMIQIGIRLQCPVCDKRNWYSVDRANYVMDCPYCLEKIPLPCDPTKIIWSYKATGPFSTSGGADGAYSVLLTLRYFSVILNAPTTPLLSFTNPKNTFEADLALFFKRTAFYENETELVFAECKTNGQFSSKDIEKLQKLGSRFPSSVLVFAKLGETLSDTEKKLLMPLVENYRQAMKTGEPRNPVLILTANELMAASWLQSDSKKGVHNTARRWETVTDLADQSNVDYLGFPPKHTIWGTE